MRWVRAVEVFITLGVYAAVMGSFRDACAPAIGAATGAGAKAAYQGPQSSPGSEVVDQKLTQKLTQKPTPSPCTTPTTRADVYFEAYQEAYRPDPTGVNLCRPETLTRSCVTRTTLGCTSKPAAVRIQKDGKDETGSDGTS